MPTAITRLHAVIEKRWVHRGMNNMQLKLVVFLEWEFSLNWKQ